MRGQSIWITGKIGSVKTLYKIAQMASIEGALLHGLEWADEGNWGTALIVAGLRGEPLEVGYSDFGPEYTPALIETLEEHGIAYRHWIAKSSDSLEVLGVYDPQIGDIERSCIHKVAMPVASPFPHVHGKAVYVTSHKQQAVAPVLFALEETTRQQGLEILFQYGFCDTSKHLRGITISEELLEDMSHQLGEEGMEGLHILANPSIDYSRVCVSSQARRGHG
ncbi:hypothetical protein ACQU0X_25575 [Pseudovibrio ascidiaceicola]|uniref:hypothetical protein n=1 Tax=Pseudovibrio ascidiaceicola TaxID=285279 RepID=UPI003D3621F3